MKRGGRRDVGVGRTKAPARQRCRLQPFGWGAADEEIGGAGEEVREREREWSVAFSRRRRRMGEGERSSTFAPECPS